MTGTAYFVPAADLLPYWPHDLLAPSDVPGIGQISQRVGVTAFDVVDYDGYLTVTGKLALWEELELRLPLVDGLSLVLGQTGGGITQVPFELRLGREVEVGDVDSTVQQALTLFLKGYRPPYELLLPELDVKLRVERSYLKPMVPNVAGDPLSGFHEAPAEARTEFVVRGAVRVSTEDGVQVDGFDRVDLDYAQIGSTGIVIRAEDVGLRLSEAQPMPADVDPEHVDLPADWTGLFFKELTAYRLDEIWDRLPRSISLTNWYFGTGGVTGKAAAIFELNPNMTGRTFALRTLQLVLQQNTLVQALVQAAVRLDFWDDKVVWLDLAVTNDPELDFPASVGILGAVSAEQPPVDVPAPPGELIPLNLSAGSTRLFHLGISKLGVRSGPDPVRAADQQLPPDTRFLDLLVDGRFQVLPASGVGQAALGAEVRGLGLQVHPGFSVVMPGGLWVDLSEQLVTRLAAFPLSITRVGMGTTQGNEKWVGLDARVALAGDAAGASVKGLRVYFGGAAGRHLAFDGIEVKIQRQPTFSLHGVLAMTSGDTGGVADATDTTFRGGVELYVGGSVGITVNGYVLFGTKSGTKFWYVALDAGFGPGIPLGATGMSLFGAALVLGSNIAPNRQLTGDHGDQFTWYRDWYKPAPGPYSVIDSAKWVPAADRWALGAGVSIGSADGKAWSIKAFLAVLSGPVVIIEGRVKLFAARDPYQGPPTSELIRGLVVLDFDEDEFLLALEVDYKVPQSGLLLDVHAEGEIFYRAGRPREWHVAIGWYEPVSRRVRATALKLFNWDAYLILSGPKLEIAEHTFPGIAFAIGYRTGFERRWKFGPVRVVIAAWFSVDVAMSVKPVYVLGQVGLHGEIAVKAYGFGVSLGVDGRLALEAPVGANDMRFGGEVELKVDLPWPLPDLHKKLPISFGDKSALPPPVDPLVDAASVTPGYGSASAALFHREQPVTSPAPLPMDGRLVIDFQRPMRSTWAPAPTPVGLARPDQVGKVWYRYTLTAVRVRVTPAAGGQPHNATEDLFGQWALSPGDDGGPRATSLILWGTSPYPTAGSLTWPGRTVRRTWEDVFAEEHPGYPCGELPPAEQCLTFDAVPLGPYDPELRHQPDPDQLPVVFRALPSGADRDALAAKLGELVQTPIEVVPHLEGKQRCLRPARTLALARAGEQSGAARATLLMWGLEVELPASRVAHGVLEYRKEDYRLRVRARAGAAVVSDQVTSDPEFTVEVGEGDRFDRLELLLESDRPPAGLDPQAAPCLVTLCWTSLGLVQQQEEAAEARTSWVRVLGPITQSTTPGAPPFGTGLVHEPGATYRVELDVRTEKASSAGGPWSTVRTATEALTARVAGAPDDLGPYLDRLVPADGERPVYADYDLRVTYNRQYVEAMYRVAGDPLRAELVDGMGRPVEPVAVRGRTPGPGLPPDVAIFVDRLAGSDCVVVDRTRIPGFDETVYRTRLATRTAYEVRLRGGGHSQPLHRWSFTTSRYRSFAGHVADFRAAPWEQALAAGADLAAVVALVAAMAGRDRNAEEDAFRQAWQQHLRLPLGTLPDRPEVTLLWTATQPAVRTLVVASPEPLFTARVTAALLDPADAARSLGWLRSRDGTRALAVPLSGTAPAPLPAGAWRLQLRQRLTGVAGLPDLSRQGSTADEVAAVPFPVGGGPGPLVDPEA